MVESSNPQVKPAVRRIGHVVLKVRDLERSRRFYEDLLGLEPAGRFRDQMLFLRSGDAHHTLGLLRVGPNAADADAAAVGLYHVAFQVDSEAELIALYQKLKQAGAAFTGFSDHRVSHSIYLEDPDGNEIEVYADQPRERWEALENPFAEIRPWNPEDAIQTRAHG